MAVELSTLGTGGGAPNLTPGGEDLEEINGELQSLLDARGSEESGELEGGDKAGEVDPDDPDGDDENEGAGPDPNEDPDEDPDEDEPKETAEKPKEEPKPEEQKPAVDLEQFKEDYSKEVETAKTAAKAEFQARGADIVGRYNQVTGQIEELGKIHDEQGQLTFDQQRQLGALERALEKILEEDQQLDRDHKARERELVLSTHIRMNEKAHPELVPWRKEHEEATRQGLTFKTATQAVAYFKSMREAATGKPVPVQPTRAEIQRQVAEEALGRRRGAAITTGRAGAGGQRDGDAARTPQNPVRAAATASFARLGLDVPWAAKGGKK